MKKFLGIIISIILIAGVGFGVFWSIQNYDKVEQGMSGTGLYVQSDLDKAYEDGYTKALSDKKDYELFIVEYKDKIAVLTDTVTKLTKTISTLETQLHETENANGVMSITLKELREQNEVLKSDIEHYKNLVSALTGESVYVVKFMLEDSIYSVQTVNSGSTAIITIPANTNTLIFNGWSVDGITPVEPSEYQIFEDITFKALVTKKYELNFIINGEVIGTQYVTNTETITPPVVEVPEGYVFDGWFVDNSAVSFDNFNATENTVFTAKLSKVYTVTFIKDNAVVSTQSIKEGTSVINVPDTAKTNYRFCGWTNGDGNNYMNLSELKITSDTTFTATYCGEPNGTFSFTIKGYKNYTFYITVNGEVITEQYYNVSNLLTPNTVTETITTNFITGEVDGGQANKITGSFSHKLSSETYTYDFTYWFNWNEADNCWKGGYNLYKKSMSGTETYVGWYDLTMTRVA